jgi:hypothetical protein
MNDVLKAMLCAYIQGECPQEILADYLEEHQHPQMRAVRAMVERPLKPVPETLVPEFPAPRSNNLLSFEQRHTRGVMLPLREEWHYLDVVPVGYRQRAINIPCFCGKKVLWDYPLDEPPTFQIVEMIAEDWVGKKGERWIYWFGRCEVCRTVYWTTDRPVSEEVKARAWEIAARRQKNAILAKLSVSLCSCVIGLHDYDQPGYRELRQHDCCWCGGLGYMLIEPEEDLSPFITPDGLHKTGFPAVGKITTCLLPRPDEDSPVC